MPADEVFIGVNLDFAACRAVVRIGVGKCEALMSSDEARKFGEQLIGAAHEADIQGFLIDWFTKQVGPLDTAQGTAIAMQFRQYVAQQRKPKPPPSGEGQPGRLT
jgi:hypothetical protein